MSFCIDGFEPMINGDNYYFISKHRRFSGKGSVWNISFREELDAANGSIDNNYIEVCNEPIICMSYNFVLKQSRIITVGISETRVALSLCKFVNTAASYWHGYPADYCKNHQDKPNQVTLGKMLNNKLIDKHLMSKISKGQR